MPKRPANSPDTAGGGGSRRAKRHRGGDSSSTSHKRRKLRVPAPPEPLNLKVVKWRCFPAEEDTTGPDGPITTVPSITVAGERLAEPGPMTWTQVLAAYQARSRHDAIHDVIFHTKDGEQVPAHSLILRIRVPFFASLFPGKREANQSETGGPSSAALSLPIPWADRDTLQAVIDVAYLTKTARDIADSLLERLYAAAMFLEWEELVTGCYEEFQERLSVANCLTWLEWSVTHHNTLVKHRASQFAAAHHETLTEERDQEMARLSLEAHLALVRLT